LLLNLIVKRPPGHASARRQIVHAHRTEASFEEYPTVWRRDRLPTVTVQADLAPGTQAATVVQSLVPEIVALNATLPSGYHISVGGTSRRAARRRRRSPPYFL